MRVVSHTCSNTEIVWALGAADLLVAIDADSDFPPDVVAPLPKLGRDLQFDVAATLALRPDLVLTSLTVPGHERIVAELELAGLPTLVCDPCSLEDIYGDIHRIGQVIGRTREAEKLVDQMREQMPAVAPATYRPKVLVEWWPKPVIAPGRKSWATDLIFLAGGENPWGARDVKSLPLTDMEILDNAPDLVVMSWCGVREENYRADIVRRRAGWDAVPAVRNDHIVPVTEAYLGRPGPRIVQGYRALRAAIARGDAGRKDCSPRGP